MLKIEFKYRDKFTFGDWRKQSCVVNTLKECIDIYGLEIDCEYEIISITKI